MSKKTKKTNKVKSKKRITKRNGHTILILGAGGEGKSHSLLKLAVPERSAYINTDNKPLPIPDRFGISSYIEKPKQVKKMLTQFNKCSPKERPVTVVLDTITHLMRNYVNQKVMTSSDTRAAWTHYLQFYVQVTEQLKLGNYNAIVMGHLTIEKEEDTGKVIDRSCPLQGQAKRLGIETDYSIILESATISLKLAKKFAHKKLLTITEEDEMMGLKRVFVTRKHKKFKFTKARLKYNLIPFNQLYINNDIQMVLDLLDNYD